MLKSLILVLVAAALLSALPAAAALNPASPAAPSACPRPAALFDFASPLPNFTPAPPAWRDDPSPDPIFYGFCACGCSPIPDCNTNEDCSNFRCNEAVSCC